MAPPGVVAHSSPSELSSHQMAHPGRPAHSRPPSTGADSQAGQHISRANAGRESSVWITEQAAFCSQYRLILALPEDTGGQSLRSPTFRSGLAACISGWALQVCISSPQQFTVDTRFLSPTFPTGWQDFDQICRLCSLRTQGWCTEIRFQSPSAECFPHQSASSSSELSTGSSHGHSILAACFLSEIGNVTLFLRPLGMGLWSHGLSSALDLLRFFSSPGSRYDCRLHG